MTRSLARALFAALAAAFAFAGVAEAASKEKIDRRVARALEDFRDDVDGANSLLSRAAGVLVFPSVKKAGIGVGGEYGEGALLIGGRTVDYYSTASASFGFQLGAQARTQIVVFLDGEVLKDFRESDGWEVGVDGSVAVITVGAGGTIDSTNLNQPVVAFVFNNKGLMYNLSLEGSKISKIDR